MGRGRDDGAVVQQRKACDFLQAGHKVADVVHRQDGLVGADRRREPGRAQRAHQGVPAAHPARQFPQDVLEEVAGIFA